MRMAWKYGLPLLIAVSAAPLAMSARVKQAHPAAVAVRKRAAAVPPQADDDGERVFQQQCSRCHNAPQGFSPRISGTIVRHMRVRASLSKKEQDELLRFLNP